MVGSLIDLDGNELRHLDPSGPAGYDIFSVQELLSAAGSILSALFRFCDFYLICVCVKLCHLHCFLLVTVSDGFDNGRERCRRLCWTASSICRSGKNNDFCDLIWRRLIVTLSHDAFRCW